MMRFPLRISTSMMFFGCIGSSILLSNYYYHKQNMRMLELQYSNSILNEKDNNQNNNKYSNTPNDGTTDQ